MASTPIFIKNTVPMAVRYGVCTHRNLPHWHIDRTMQFDTFRLADSIRQIQLTIFLPASGSTFLYLYFSSSFPNFILWITCFL